MHSKHTRQYPSPSMKSELVEKARCLFPEYHPQFDPKYKKRVHTIVRRQGSIS